MKIVHDYYERNEPSKIYLATPTKQILCALNSVDIDSVDFVGKCNNLSTISFTINRYIEDYYGNLIEANGYELVSKFMRLYVTNIGWFIIDTPEIHSDGNDEYKTINASSAEIEFKQIPLDTWKVNKGTTDSLEMLIDENVEEIEGVEFAKENIKFYNPKNKDLSLVDILVSKVDGWEVGYIDNIPKVYESIDNGETTKTSVLLADEVGMFDISYSNAYAFMMQDFEKFFNCIVEFDYLNFKVNFYRVENFGKDTSVTIGFRNVQNTSDVTVDEDNIFTKFRVAGGNNLGIEQFNGGSNYLIMLDEYWLNQKYLSESTIDKYKKWSNFCNIARYKYGEYSRQWNTLQEQITELKIRVPNMDCDPDRWDKLSDEELLTLKSDYEAQKLGYEKIYVDQDGHFDINALEKSPDANIYHQIVDTILPNINIEIENRKLPTSEGEKDFITIYETTWKYYGVSELEIKLASYQDIVNVLKKSHYDLTWERYQELSKQDNQKYPTLTEDGFKDKHEEYLKASNQLDVNKTDSCAYALKQRKLEVSEKETQQKIIGDNRDALGNKMALETWKGQLNLTSPDADGFTLDELNEINHILNQTTYTNENIFTTTLDGLSENVDMQQKLCETALDDIAVYSIPQTIYDTTLDNILSASGNELHANDLNYGNFIRVGIRDDYYVKLRVMGIGFNPCLYDNKFSLQFSNMIKSGKKRNDFVSLLDMAGNLSNSSANTSFSGDINLSDDNIYQILTKILQSSLFSNKIQNIINGVIGNGNTGGLKPGDIIGNNAFFEYIQAELIAANKIVANSGDFKELSALVARIDNLLAGNVSAELGHIIELTAKNVRIDSAVIRDMIAAQITVSMLQAGTISANKFNIKSDDGGMEIVGNTMQFKDKNGTIRIQIGRDSKDNFTFCLYDETGKGVLIDSTGIKDSAITDGLIVNNMISDGTIGKEKFNFSILETDENGNIVQSGKVVIDKNGIETKFETINNTVTQIQGQIDGLGENFPSAMSVILGNESQNLPCDAEGKVIGQHLIEIPFLGYAGTKRENVSAVVGLLPDGMTLGENTESTPTQEGKIVLNVANGAFLGGSNVLSGKIQITFTIKNLTIGKRFNWCKATQGTDGNIELHNINTSTPILFKDIKGIINPNTVTFDAVMRISDSTETTPYLGLFVVKESTDGIKYTNKYLSPNPESKVSYKLSSNDVVSIQCILSDSKDVAKELDVITIPVLTDEGIKSEITEMKTTMGGISSNLDAVNKKFTDKVWQTDIITQINNYDGTTVNGIRDRVTQTEKDINGITNTVSDVETALTKKADGSTVQALTERVSKAEQDAEGFKQTVEQNYIQKNDLQSSSRNLIRNSKNMIYKDYYLNSIIGTYITDETGAYLTDETGNILTI